MTAGIHVYLVDGTYELFRQYFGVPSASSPSGAEVGATRGLAQTLLSLVKKRDVTHIACAFDHVIESFRNLLFSGYKTGEGLPEELTSQFGLAERMTAALGIVVWPMVDFEADDALATGAHRFGQDPRVDQVWICSPDKDLLQCVRGERVVAWDRQRERVYDEAAVVEKLGVPPLLVPDYLALVGDAADGIPGIARWGKASAARVLSRYGSLEAIPERTAELGKIVRGADALLAELHGARDAARLYKKLTTLRTDVPLPQTLDDLAYAGAHRSELETVCRELGAEALLSRVEKWGPVN